MFEFNSLSEHRAALSSTALTRNSITRAQNRIYFQSCGHREVRKQQEERRLKMTLKSKTLTLLLKNNNRNVGKEVCEIETVRTILVFFDSIWSWTSLH